MRPKEYVQGVILDFGVRSVRKHVILIARIRVTKPLVNVTPVSSGNGTLQTTVIRIVVPIVLFHLKVIVRITETVTSQRVAPSVPKSSHVKIITGA